MFDINFYKKSYPIKKNITQGKLSLNEFETIEKELETLLVGECCNVIFKMNY